MKKGTHFGVDAITGERWSLESYSRCIEETLSGACCYGRHYICVLPAYRARCHAAETIDGLPILITPQLVSNTPHTAIVRDLPCQIRETRASKIVKGVDDEAFFVLDGDVVCSITRMRLVGTGDVGVVSMIAQPSTLDPYKFISSMARSNTERELVDMVSAIKGGSDAAREAVLETPYR